VPWVYNVEGLMNHPYALRDCLSKVCGEAKDYLEVGVQEGNSLRVVLAEAAALESVTLVDTWGGQYGGTARGGHEHIERLVAEVGFAGRVTFLDGDSHVILPAMIVGKVSFDLVTIDGDHSEAGGAEDLRDGWKLVRPGGWLVFDDITHPAHPYLKAVAERFIAEVQPAEVIWNTELPEGAVAMRKGT
jgi:hypothetical protein